MNKVQLIGRTTKDIEIRYGQNAQTAIARFTLAVNRQRKADGNPEADFISCIAFGKTAEIMEKYVRKGDQVGIVGRIQTGSYEKDGHKVYTTDVIVESIEFLSRKNESKATQGDSQTDIPEGFSQLTDEDIPF